MSSLKLLLLSNSTSHGSQYLQSWRSGIDRFLSNVNSVLFVPFAAVTIDWKEYANKVSDALVKYEVKNIADCEDMTAAVNEAEAICIGGGNTFHLLLNLQKYNLLAAIKRRVQSGVPYIGWSAGSNVASLDIGSTNDMPIVWPSSDAAIGLVSYNINPHFTEYKPPKYCGEDRGKRLDECCFVKQRPIVALSEGTGILVDGEHKLQRHTIIAGENVDSVQCKLWLPDANCEQRQKIVDVAIGTDIYPIISDCRKL
ncbi:alpha-aspartyl dipeptidase-like protein [Dinothrombium tinctorium]|uniref:Alpha-aspartyl dipeptidase-like protein n=1 Tax=Dinothrombium tinctorium TaxID=1965070 RepID=A0A3S3Q844_9ACAR|nr:alpha-aspartyl dipeptidase-like protein [Dinothrombium tinctorium]